MRNMGKTKKAKIDKKIKKLKTAMKKAGKKSRKVDRSDVPLVSPPVTTDLIWRGETSAPGSVTEFLCTLFQRS